MARALLKKEDARWKGRGKRSKILCRRQPSKKRCGESWGHHIGTCMAAKYSDYIIYGNMILLCEGYEPEVSMLNCSNIIEKLVKEE